MWVRGLKLSVESILCAFLMSHPMWVRGLKRVFTRPQASSHLVAPHVGAWIETCRWH